MANVITRLLYTFGTGNMCFKIVETLSPTLVEKLWKIKCGYAYDIVGNFYFTSCLSTTFWSPKYTVGPTGKWQTIIPSGTPLCSCNNTKSEILLVKHKLTKSFRTYAPLFIL